MRCSIQIGKSRPVQSPVVANESSAVFLKTAPAADTAAASILSMAQTVSLATGTPASPASISRSNVVTNSRPDDSAESGASGRSVFDRLGNRSTGNAAHEPVSVSAESIPAAIITEDEDGEMTGSTSDDEPPQTVKGPTSGSRILSLRTVVGTGGRTGSSNRSGRHSPIIYEHISDALSENKTNSSFQKTQIVSSVSRSLRHQNTGAYDASRALPDPVPNPRPDVRRRRSSNGSNHAYERRSSHSLTPPHLRDSTGLKYDRHGNLRRTPAAVSSPGPHSHPYISGKSSRSHVSRHRWSPSESSPHSYASPSSSSKYETYRKYFDEYRKRGERPQRTDSCDPLVPHCQTLPVSSALHNDLLEPDLRISNRVACGSSRTSQRQNVQLEHGISVNKHQSTNERKDKSENELESVLSLKPDPDHEVEEGEDFSDWSEAEAGNDDEDLDSISSTDEILAHILTSNHQPCSETDSHELLKDQDDDIIEQANNCNDRKNVSACTASTEKTDSWKGLLSMAQLSSAAKDRIKGTSDTRGWGRGVTGAAYALQSSGFSSRLSGSDLSHELEHFIHSNCNRRTDVVQQLTSPQDNTSSRIYTANSHLFSDSISDTI